MLLKHHEKVDMFEALAMLAQVSAQLIQRLPADLHADGVKTVIMNVNLVLDGGSAPAGKLN